MRVNRTAQPSVFQPDEIVHPRGSQLERASEWLDEHPELLAMVGACVAGSPSCGRRGLTCETILRCAVLIHLMGYSYRESGVQADRFGVHEALRADRSVQPAEEIGAAERHQRDRR